MFRWWRVDGNKSLAQIAYDHTQQAPSARGVTTRGWHSSRPKGIKHFLSTSFGIHTQLSWLSARRSNYLGSYSSILQGLAEAAQQRGIDLKFDLIFSFGTVVEDHLRTLCRTIFKSEIADTYGSQELGHLAAQCCDCGEYHISSEMCLIEVLREDGSPASRGEIGRVVATQLYSYAMPFIRYELGDMAEVGKVDPDCCRKLPTLRRILGRYRNLFRFRDGTTIWPLPLHFTPVREFIAAKQFQVIQKDFDHLEIRYVPDDARRPIDLSALTDHIRNELRQQVSVTVCPVDRIDRSPTGKYEDFISLVPRTDAPF
jgi:phenylacetate-CoA ligase